MNEIFRYYLHAKIRRATCKQKYETNTCGVNEGFFTINELGSIWVILHWFEIQNLRQK